MIRVLFLTHDSSLYGAQLSLLGLLSQLDRDEFEVMVVAPHEGPLNEAIAGLGIPIIVRKMVPWIASGAEARKSHLHLSQEFFTGLKGRVWSLAHLIERNKIDIVYTNTIVPIDGALAAHVTRRPHIWHLREQVGGNSQLKTLMPSWLISLVVGWLSAQAIVNSRYLREAYAFGQTTRKLNVIYNGVDPDPFNKDRSDSARSLRAELSLAATAQLVTLIGAVIPRKGQLLLAQSAVTVLRQLPLATFLIVGEGDAEYIHKIKSYCASKGIQERIYLLGWRPDIPRLIAASDLLVVAADEEPFGRTVIEAMAAGTPVVSTRCGGPEEIVIDQVTGLLVPKGEADNLAQAILRILEDKAEASRFSSAGRERFQNMFTLDAHAHQVQSLIAEVVRNHSNS